MKIIGLDLSLLSTGVCILSGEQGQEPVVSNERIPQQKTKGVRESVERLCGICSKIVQIVKNTQPDAVVIEAPAKNQVWQMAAIGEIHGVVKMQLWLACGIVPVVEQATKMRKHVIGSIEGKFETVQVKIMKGKNKGKTKTVKRKDYGTIIGKSGKPRKASVKDVIEERLRERKLEFPSQDEMDAYVAARYLWDAQSHPGDTSQ